MKPLALVGISGAGKTTVGQRLANALVLPFLDTDASVEEHLQCSISEVFRDPERGEPYFRALEAATVKAALRRGGPMVMALGGGAVVDRKTRQLLKEHAVTIWFQVDADVAYRRTTEQPGVRPLLTGPDGPARLRYLAEERRAYYAAAADYAVNADQEPDAVLHALSLVTAQAVAS